MDPSLPEGLHEGIGAALYCYIFSNGEVQFVDDWRSFNLSSWQADQVVKEIKPLLTGKGYHFTKNKYPLQVRTPGKSVYECQETVDVDVND
jgi:hypothetical protein